MATHSLRDLYLDELRDLFDAEQQILQTLPTMMTSASSPALKRVFEDHLEQTRTQSERLQLIFQQLGESSRGKRCFGVEGLIKEGQERLRETAPNEVRDAALIGAAQRVEHYEIAAYGTARTYAERLGAWDQADLLQQTLDEEGEADHRLTGIAESGINQAAQREGASLGDDLRRRSRLRYVDLDDLPRESFAARDLRVRNQIGDDLGQVDGLVVEESSGRPRYYVIDSGGWFIGRRYLVPVGKGRLDAAQNLIIHVDREKLHRHPEFNANAFLTMSEQQARAYERRIMSAVNPEAARERRYWESYDRLPEYAAPNWLAVSNLTEPRRVPASAAEERERAARHRARQTEPGRELITAHEETSTIVEGQQSQPSQGVRGVVEEPPRKREDDEGLR